ncbi:hypothetical protein P171DRAFT_506446 [Karstenula rhodostoma CBS 690.94]|uniref:CCHC-type domain-containing protein n=1 Tax=Karstenula rhodostoma CBS 690.94 TaxID=1392251 RepID=A0A9P4U3V7_9PLEO|nr:hypothetical protein P171DRAFT_506446 [Karstenula rhodostoma CBS 690.94]
MSLSRSTADPPDRDTSPNYDDPGILDDDLFDVERAATQAAQATKATSPDYEDPNLLDDDLFDGERAATQAAQATQATVTANDARSAPPEATAFAHPAPPGVTLDMIFTFLQVNSQVVQQELQAMKEENKAVKKELQAIKGKVDSSGNTTSSLTTKTLTSASVALAGTQITHQADNRSVVSESSQNNRKNRPRKKKRPGYGAFKDHKPGTVIPCIRIRVHDDDKDIAASMHGPAFISKLTELSFNDPYHHIRSAILLNPNISSTRELLLQVDCWDGYKVLCQPQFEKSLIKTLGLHNSFTVRNQYWVEVFHYILGSDVKDDVNSHIDTWSRQSGLSIAQAQLRASRLFFRFDTVSGAEKACSWIFCFGGSIAYATPHDRRSMRSHCTWCTKPGHTERTCEEKKKGKKRVCLNCAATGHSKHNINEDGFGNDIPGLPQVKCKARRGCGNCGQLDHSTEGQDCEDPKVLEHIKDCKKYEGEQTDWSRHLVLPKFPRVPMSCGREPTKKPSTDDSTTTNLPASNQAAAAAAAAGASAGAVANPGDAARHRSGMAPLDPAPPKVSNAEQHQAYKQTQKKATEISLARFKSDIARVHDFHYKQDDKRGTVNLYVDVTLTNDKRVKRYWKELRPDDFRVIREWWIENKGPSDLRDLGMRVQQKLGLSKNQEGAPSTLAATQTAEDPALTVPTRDQSTDELIPDHSHQLVDHASNQHGQDQPTTQLPATEAVRSPLVQQTLPSPTIRSPGTPITSIELPQFVQEADTHRAPRSPSTDFRGFTSSPFGDGSEFVPSSSGTAMPQASSQPSLDAGVNDMSLREPRVSAKGQNSGRGNGQGSRGASGDVAGDQLESASSQRSTEVTGRRGPVLRKRKDK